MVPDVKAIENLCDEVISLRNRLLNDIPEIFHLNPDLLGHAAELRCSLLNVYKDLDKILVDLDC